MGSLPAQSESVTELDTRDLFDLAIMTSIDASTTHSAFASSLMPYLTTQQLEDYDRDGYLVIRDFFSTSLAQRLKSHADQLLAALDHDNHPRSVFKTSNNSKAASQTFSPQLLEEKNEMKMPDVHVAALPENNANDRYFLNSADRIGFFYEAGALSKDGTLCVDKLKSVNKIGHYLHVLDPVFREFTFSTEIMRLAKDLQFIDPIVLQSMLIFKQPFIGGIVDKHRDSTFLFTRPSTAVGFWFTLEDVTHNNGALSFVKGSHKDQGSNRRFVREGHVQLSINNIPPRERLDLAGPLSGPDNVHSKSTFIGEDRTIDQYTEDQWVEECVPAGSLILIHGDVCHASTPNKSEKSRFIYTFHVIEDEGVVYDSRNWLQSHQPFPHLFTFTQDDVKRPTSLKDLQF